jgi:aminoglycoside/choline kinase family phosphotransferase
VAAQPIHLLHRDYQSQNLLVKDGRLRLVDFQGLRPGPLGYDLASLLWDPYVAIGAERRRELLTRYAAQVRERLDPALTTDAVRAMVLAAALQRLQQALGAYGFLSVVKGRTGFLAHVPRALAHLREVLGLVAAARAEASPGARWLPPPVPRLEAVLAGLDEPRLQRRLRAVAENPPGGGRP